jgi:rhodanese-related sulfurtransferase
MKKYIRSMLSPLMFVALAGGANASDKISPQAVDGATTVSAAEAKDLFDNGTLFVDTRKDKDWNAGRIPDAVHLDVKKVLSEDTLSNEVKKDEAVVMYCNGESCMRSSKASAMAVEWGFSKVYYFRDGFPAWKSAGYPVE